MSAPRPAPAPGRTPLVFAAGLSVGVLSAVLVASLRRDAGIDAVRAVRDLASESFVDELDADALVDDALRGMVEGLDRYSHYYGREEIARLERETSGEFRGIGVVFRPPSRDGQILFPLPDSPAGRAGIRVGDRIASLNASPVAAMGPGELQRRIQEGGGAELRITLVGLDGGEREVAVLPERLVDPTVRHARLLDPECGIGYLAILSFSHRTPQEFDHTVAELQREGLRALVIDLRANPGGILDAAVAIANRFVASGALVATKTRVSTQILEARPQDATLAGMPLTILTDGGSASASEVLAGALQDHSAAVVVGEPTYGKGTVQTLTRLASDRAIVKMTTATYYTPAWRSIERGPNGQGGLVPDVQVELEDEARAAIHRHLASYSPPPSLVAEIREWELATGLDLVPLAPEDPQLDAALALLRGEAPALHARRTE
jgi:carboxyl-terminal processing protease